MIKVNDYEKLIDLLPEICVILTVMIIAVIVLILIWKKVNIKNGLVTKRVRIRKKIVKNRNVECYIAECQDGERLKLKSFQASTLPISVGDIGIVSYRGTTIQEFTRQAIFTR